MFFNHLYSLFYELHIYFNFTFLKIQLLGVFFLSIFYILWKLILLYYIVHQFLLICRFHLHLNNVYFCFIETFKFM